MNIDTRWFLNALLWDVVSQGLDDTGSLIGKTADSFSPRFVAAVETFISDFRNMQEKSGFDMALFNSMVRPFGVNLYLSLGSNMGGFSSENAPELAELHERICGGFELLSNYIVVRPDGSVDLDYPEKDLDRMYRKVFRPYTEE